jgi:acetyl esterase/lipase
MLGRLVAPNVKKLQGVALEARTRMQPPLRIYRPLTRRSGAAPLWIHGGGFVLGNAAVSRQSRNVPFSG